MASQSPKIAFAGLGAMGYGMAAHLVKSGFAVTGFDVYQPALDRFSQEVEGALAAKTPREAAQDVDFFICMVANSVQATPLLFDGETGAVKELKENATIIMYSTVAPAYIEEIQRRLKDIFAGIHIAMANEAMGLAAAAGLDTKDAYEKLKGSEASSWMFENRVPPMLDSNSPRFPLPLLSTAEQLYLTAISNGWGAEDDCVLVRLYLPPDQGDLVVRQVGTKSSPTAPNVSHNVSWETIRDIMIGVHVAAITEAMGFCEHIGIDVALMYDVVNNAAGNSRMLESCFRGLKKQGWRVWGLEESNGIVDRLAKAVDDVCPLQYPLFLGSAALQELWRQRRTG
ncbi:MAG: hypothetical protein Q9213_005418 [Squamulea squamosa]